MRFIRHARERDVVKKMNYEKSFKDACYLIIVFLFQLKEVDMLLLYLFSFVHYFFRLKWKTFIFPMNSKELAKMMQGHTVRRQRASKHWFKRGKGKLKLNKQLYCVFIEQVALCEIRKKMWKMWNVKNRFIYSFHFWRCSFFFIYERCNASMALYM